MMKILAEQIETKVPVTVMKLEGELDASCYLDVIERAKLLYESGTRDLLLDLSDMSFMASSGLVTMHSIALIMRGDEPPNPEDGWGAFRSMAHETQQTGEHQPHFKLLNPQPRVAKTLETTGFNNILSVYTDREAALASYSA